MTPPSSTSVAPETRRALLGLAALGLALRLAVAVALGIDRPPAFGTDQYEYDDYAWNVARGRGYRGISPDVADREHLTAYRPPGTSLAWAGLYYAFGHRYEAVRVAHCLVGAATIFLVFGIGRRCYGEGVGLTAAGLFAAYPISWLYSVELLSEALGTFWLLGFVLACLAFADRPTWSRAALAGLLLGLSVLTRPNSVLLLPLVGLWALRQFRKDWRALALSTLIPAVMAATMVPWVARNYRVFGEFIPFSTMGGSVLLQGNNRVVATEPKYAGYSVWDTEIPEYKAALEAPGDEVGRDKVARVLAVRWLKDNPDKWGYLLRSKFIRSWTPLLQPHSPLSYRLGMLLCWGPLLLLSAVALLPTLTRSLREGDPSWLLHLAILHYAINSLIFFGNARYRYPIEPICMVLAAWLAACAWRSFRGAGRSPVVAGLAHP